MVAFLDLSVQVLRNEMLELSWPYRLSVNYLSINVGNTIDVEHPEIRYNSMADEHRRLWRAF